MPVYSLLISPTNLTTYLLKNTERSATIKKFAVSVNILSLNTSSARQNWINELLRFL